MMNVVREVLFGGRGKVEGMRERMETTDRKINDLLQYIDMALNNVRRVSRVSESIFQLRSENNVTFMFL